MPLKKKENSPKTEANVETRVKQFSFQNTFERNLSNERNNMTTD